MNLDKIYQGQTIKNYKELCDLLGLKQKSGASKRSQLKELERHIKFTKNGHQFHIDQIYNKALIKVDNRSLAKGQSVYIDHVSIQLLHYLASKTKTEGTNFEFITSNNLFRLTGMVNANYLPTRQAIREFIEENPYSLTRFDIDEFYQRTNDKMRSILRSTLSNLKNRWLILYETRHLITDGWKDQRISNEKEEGEIMDIKNKIAWDMGVKSERQVYLTRRADEFYTRFNDEVYRKFGWTKVFTGWNITFHSSQLQDNIRKYELEIEELEKHQKLLNNKFANYIVKSAKDRYKKNQDEYDQYEKLVEEVWGELSNVKISDPPFRYQEDFVKSQMLLTELFIKPLK